MPPSTVLQNVADLHKGRNGQVFHFLSIENQSNIFGGWTVPVSFIEMIADETELESNSVALEDIPNSGLDFFRVREECGYVAGE